MNQYQNIQNILRRVRTFKRIYFYHNQIVNIYELAFYGFLVQQNQVVCQICNKLIKFDSPQQQTQIKQSFNSAIKNHKSQCLLIKNSIYLQKHHIDNMIIQNLEIIYNQIKQSYNITQKGIKIDQNDWLLTLNGNNYPSLYQNLDSQFEGRQYVEYDIILSLFGWKLKSQYELQCIFCGSLRDITLFKQNSKTSYIKYSQGFKFYSEHKIWCMILNNKINLWDRTLKKLVKTKINQVKGDLQKTQEQIKAKNLRKQIHSVYNKILPTVNKLYTKIEELSQKAQIKKLDQQSIRKKCFKKVRHLIDDFKEEVEKGIKKIKLNQ